MLTIKCMIHNNMISVIVAHAGCRFFYKFLVSEAKRAEVEPSCFDDIKFCDNLQHLQQVLYIHRIEHPIHISG